MPYTLWLTRHHRLEDVKARAPDKLTLEDPQGEYALAQGRIFFQRRKVLYLNVRMPFEVPAGQQDDARGG
jgi:hypothetical protein